MIDRESFKKWMIGLLKANDQCPFGDCNACAYGRHENCYQLLRKDYLDFMNGKAEQTAHWKDDTGHWIEGDRNGEDPHNRTGGQMIDTFCCSWCGYYLYWKTPYCPNCGSKMKG